MDNLELKTEEKKKIIIGSEGMGIWGKDVIEYILKKLNYTIEYKNTNDCEIILHHLFTNIQPRWNTQKKKYIHWSNESLCNAAYNPNQTKKLFVYTNLNLCLNDTEYVFIPYFLYNSHITNLYKGRKYTNENRKYLVAYCSRNCKKNREGLFNLLVEKAGKDLCCSFSRCCGKFPNTRKPVGGDWQDQKLIDKYKDYKFVFAMENGYHKGYVTEKIINAFYSGAIPIYYGAPDINEYFNPKAFINVSNFSSLEECANYIVNMSEEEIQKMSQEKVFNEKSEIANLLNENFKDNKTLQKYMEIFKNFCE